MRKIYQIGLLIFIIGVIALFVRQKESVDFRGTVYNPPLPAVDFSLLQSDGRTFRLSEQRGKVVLIYFGYTFCPDACPTTLHDLSQALQKLDEKQRERVVVVFISVDPARDTPEHVQEYVHRFSPSFIGLSGSEAQLWPIWNAYGVVAKTQTTNSAAGYLIAHTAHVFLIDPNGFLRILFPFGTPPEDIAHDLVLILRQ